MSELLGKLEAALLPKRRAGWPLVFALGSIVVAAMSTIAVWAAQRTTPRYGSLALQIVIARVIRDHHDDLETCYTTSKLAPAKGSVGLRFEIAGDGHVRGVAIERDDVPDTSLARCLAAAAWKWNFPPGTPTDVRVPLVLGP